MRARVHRTRISGNHTNHNEFGLKQDDVKRVVVTKEDVRRIYEDFVLVVYNATSIITDNATFELLGFNQSDCLKGLNEQQKDAVLTRASQQLNISFPEEIESIGQTPSRLLAGLSFEKSMV